MRIAANLNWLFTEAPMLERPALARAAGFDGVEMTMPYGHALEEWVRALDGFPVALVNTPAGDWAAGERGFAAVPGAEARFRADFARALEVARAIGAARIHVMAGIGGDEATFLANLHWAAAQGHPLTIEPLNPGDMPGYFLSDFAQAARIAAAVPEVGVQFDTWHAVRLGGIEACWRVAGPWVTHVQIAGEPDRGEPDAGTLAFAAKAGVEWVGAEYRPLGGTGAGLGWLALRP